MTLLGRRGFKRWRVNSSPACAELFGYARGALVARRALPIPSRSALSNALSKNAFALAGRSSGVLASAARIASRFAGQSRAGAAASASPTVCEPIAIALSRRTAADRSGDR
jgi:hypothetical protein